MNEKPKRGALAAVFVYVVVELLGMSLVLPLLPFYARTFAASPILIGLIGTSNALAQIVGAPLIGRLSDRYGRRPLLILGISASLVGFVMLGLARSLAMVFASRILDGLLGGNIALAQSYITDVTDEQGRARGLGMIGAAFGIGFIIGPAAGGLLSRLGEAVPALAAAGLSLVNLVWVLAAVPESLTPERRAELAMSPRPPVSARALVQALRRPLVGPLLHTRLFYALAFGIFQGTFALYASARLGLEAQSTGYVLAYVGLLAVAVQGGAVAPLVKRFPERSLIPASMALMAASLAAWGLVPSVGLLLAVLAPLSLSAGVLNTVLSSALSKAVPHDEVGGTLGLAASLQSLAGVVAPALGGLLLQELGAWSLGLASGAIMAWLAVFAWRKVRRPAAAVPEPA